MDNQNQTSSQMDQSQNDSTGPTNTGNYNTLVIVGYVLPILFFINLNKSSDEKFHANQQLVLLLAGIASTVVDTVLSGIPLIGWLVGLALSILLLVLWVIGIVHGVKNETKPLPMIGGISLIG
jgi:uncharacterized membrane protein